MARILITGATGFIGGHLIRTLRPHQEVFGLVRRRPEEGSLQGVHWIEHDLNKPLDHSALPENLDAIIHLAQSKLYKQFPDGAKDIFGVNIQSTFQLLEYGRQAGIECFVFASTGGVYGYSGGRLVETDRVNPQNFYLRSKYTGELLIANYERFFRTVVFRFFFVYGPGQEGMLIPTLVRKILKGETIVIEGNPGLRINPIYIEDAIRVFEPALHLPTSHLFNVSGDEEVTILGLINLVETTADRKAIVRHSKSKPHGDLVADNRRMKEILNVHPNVSLHEGLSRMV
jgi:nucleoside-diphosphate-sugar epimerase